MSWIADLAGKAENILNKLDNEAASVLTKQSRYVDSSSHQYAPSSTYQSEPAKTDHKRSSSCNFPSSVSVPVNLNDVGASGGYGDKFEEAESLNSSPKRTKNKKWSQVKGQQENSLIDFLNEGQKTSSSASEGNDNVIITSSNAGHSRQSSVSSGSSFLAVSGRNTPGFASLESSSGSGGAGSTDAYITVDAHPELQMSTSGVRSGSDLKALSSDKYRGKEMEMLQSSSSQECVMLRKEVTSLNQEMTQVLRRCKEAEKESQRLRDKLSNISLQQRQSDALLRDMQEKESRLQVALKTKESLLTPLQAKLQNIDQKMKEREDNNRVLHEQNQSLLEGATMSNSLNSEVVSSLQGKLRDIEDSLQMERKLHSRLRDETGQRIIQLEEDQTMLTKDVSDLTRKLQEEKSRSTALKTQISSLKNELASSNNELSDYKLKAGRILKSKDKLISSLKEGISEGGQEELLKEEMEQIRDERDLLQEELIHCQERIMHLSGEVMQTKVLAQQEAKTTQQQISQIQEDLDKEQSEKGLIQDELRLSKHELKSLQEELARQKIILSSRLQERDEEIERLQKQIAHRHSSSSSISDLEKRIHGLTESLIMKQTTIETLSTDKHTLQIQLEKIQERYQESQSMLNKDSLIDIAQEDVRNRGVPSFLMESPFDGGVSRRVKKAYGTLDKFSVRLGVFLRRYPMARVFVLLYMGLLHAWVMIVLLTYKPEIHGSEFVHPHPIGNGGVPLAPKELKGG